MLQFLNNPYGSNDAYLNSTSNKRRVGILIKRKCNVSVLRSVADPEENFLLLEAVLAGKKCTFGSIYGPNTTNQAFFQNLSREITTLDCPNVILAGDWNCTISLDPARTNIDCLNMADIPNRTHSLLLYEMCELLNLSDPFRTLKPNAREYTYVPRSVNAINRSPIDFFLISTGLTTNHMECTIAANLQNKLFDHRACLLRFTKSFKSANNSQVINSRILNHDIVDLIIFASCAEAYVIHAADAIPVPLRREKLLRIGSLKQDIKSIGPPVLPCNEIEFDTDIRYAAEREANIRLAELCKDDIDLDLLQSWPMDPDPDVFFETLIGMIKK
jgi:exonuclease III